MIKNMKSGTPNLFKQGSKTYTGKLATTQRSLEAVVALSDILRTSFGPNGLNKIVVNHLGKISITSDCVTILNNIDVNHPAAKMVAMAAMMQEKEIGDGSNYVVILAGELCKIALEMMSEGVEINDIVLGYESAKKTVSAIIKDLEYKTANTADKNEQIIKTAICPKIFGYESHFAPLIRTACDLARAKEPNGQRGEGFNVADIRVAKVPGGSIFDSFLSTGLVLTEKLLPEPRDHNFSLRDVRVAAFNGSVDAQTTETKGVVLFENADQMLGFNSGEEKRVELAVDQLAGLGVRVIVTGGKFGDIALHFMAKKGIYGLQITSKFDLQRIARLVGCNAIPLFGEKVSKEDLGFCKTVSRKDVGMKQMTFIEQDDLDASLATIVVRGNTDNCRDNVEKAIDDGINALKTATKDGRVLLGGGASEIQLSSLLIKRTDLRPKNPFAKYGFEGFARAFEAIPKIIAKSSDMDKEEAVASLLTENLKSYEEKGKDSLYTLGIDVENGLVADMAKIGVFDLLASKENSIRLATDAVCTILRIDSIIMAKPAGGPKVRENPDWDQD